MSTAHRSLVAVIIFFVASTVSAAEDAAATAPEQIPIRDFFRFTEFQDLSLSPDGAWLGAVHVGSEGARNLVVLNLSTQEARDITGFSTGGVRNFFWKDQDTLMFWGIADLQADGAGAGRTVGFYSIDVDGSRRRTLEHAEFTSIMDRKLGDDDWIIGTGSDNRGYTELVKVNASSGRQVTLEGTPPNFTEFYLDGQGQARAAVAHLDNQKRFRLYYRDAADGDWREVMEYGALFINDRDLHVEGFDSDDRHLIVRSRIDRDRYAVYRLDPVTAELGEPLAEDPVFDIEGVRFTNPVHEGGRPAYAFSRADVPERYFLDSRWKEVQAMIDQAFPETHNTIVDANRAEDLFIVRAETSRQPSIYYLLDLTAGSVKYLLNSRDWTDARKMGETRPITYEARDGLDIHGYLTLPADWDGEPVPMIINPHGGPYGIRDSWGWQPERQFFASRGWATLQPNFRGSGGYGREFQTRAYRKWGLEMQDDITDAVHWAIEQGYADPERVCIYGASYGGYATLMGLIKTPELFRCGVDYVGVTSLYDIYRDDTRMTHNAVRDFFMGTTMDAYLGPPSEHEDRYRATSPIYHVDAIEAPLFVIHGREDDRVKVDQYHRLVRELESQDKDFQKLLRRYEGHGFASRENAEELYGSMEEFLSRHLD